MEILTTKSLTELTAEYYDLIGRDHHKDDDRHFYIKKIYSYGEEPYWQFFHYGYCYSIEYFHDEVTLSKWSGLKDFVSKEQFPKRRSEEMAEQDMRIFLDWIIEKEKKKRNI